jgi:hypothetical protein
MNLKKLRQAYAAIESCVPNGRFTKAVQDELLSVLHDAIRNEIPPTIKASISVDGEDVGSVQPVTGDPVKDLEAAKLAALKMVKREADLRGIE